MGYHESEGWAQQPSNPGDWLTARTGPALPPSLAFPASLAALVVRVPSVPPVPLAPLAPLAAFAHLARTAVVAAAAALGAPAASALAFAVPTFAAFVECSPAIVLLAAQDGGVAMPEGTAAQVALAGKI